MADEADLSLVSICVMVGVMIESSFRLLKHVQFGDASNLRQATELWLKAAKRKTTR